MNTQLQRLIHWMGILGALGGLVWLIGLGTTEFMPRSLSRTYTPMMISGLILMSFGMIGAYLRLIRRIGLMAIFALALGIMSAIFLVFTWVLVETNPVDPMWFATAFMLLLASLAILSVMAMWSGGVNRMPLALMLIGLAILPFMSIRGGNAWVGMILGVAWVWLGLDLLQTKLGEETAVSAL